MKTHNLLRPRGFTLIELMVVISILAILLAAVAPSFRNFMGTQYVKSASYDLTADLLLARSEALKRGTAVQITPLTGGNWVAGWKTTVETDGTVVSQHGALDSSLSFSTQPAAIEFDANGRVSAPSSALRITLSSSASGTYGERCIQLDPSGRARAAVGACS